MFGYLRSHLRITFGAILLFHVLIRSDARPVNSSNNITKNVNVIFECIINQPCDNCRSWMMMAIEISKDGLNNITLPISNKTPFCILSSNKAREIVIYDKEKEISLSEYYFEFKDDELQISFNEILNKKNMYSIYIPCEYEKESRSTNKKTLKEIVDISSMPRIKESKLDNNIKSVDYNQCQDLSTVHRDILIYTNLLKLFPESQNFSSPLLFVLECSSKAGATNVKYGGIETPLLLKEKIQQGNLDQTLKNDNIDVKFTENENNLKIDKKGANETQNLNTKLPITTLFKFTKINHEKTKDSFAVKTNHDDCNSSSTLLPPNLYKLKEKGKMYDDRRHKRYYIFEYRDSKTNFTVATMAPVDLSNCDDEEITEVKIDESSVSETKLIIDGENFKNSTYRYIPDVLNKNDTDYESSKIDNDDYNLWDLRRRRSMKNHSNEIPIKNAGEDSNENAYLLNGNSNYLVDGEVNVVTSSDHNRYEEVRHPIVQSVQEVTTQYILTKESKVDDIFDKIDMNKTLLEIPELYNDNIYIPYIRQRRDVNLKTSTEELDESATESFDTVKKVQEENLATDVATSPYDYEGPEGLEDSEDDLNSNSDTVNSYTNQSLDDILQNGNDYHIDDVADPSANSTIKTLYEGQNTPDTENVSLPIDENLLTGNFSNPVTHLNVTSETNFEGDESEIATDRISTDTPFPTHETLPGTEEPPATTIPTISESQNYTEILSSSALISETENVLSSTAESETDDILSPSQGRDESTTTYVPSETVTEAVTTPFIETLVKTEELSTVSISTETKPIISDTSTGSDESSTSNDSLETEPISAPTISPYFAVTSSVSEISSINTTTLDAVPSTVVDNSSVTKETFINNTPSEVDISLEYVTAETSSLTEEQIINTTPLEIVNSSNDPISPSTENFQSSNSPSETPTSHVIDTTTDTVVTPYNENILEDSERISQVSEISESSSITSSSTKISDINTPSSTQSTVSNTKLLDLETDEDQEVSSLSEELQTNPNTNPNSIDYENDYHSSLVPTEKYISKESRKSKASNFYSPSYITITFITLIYYFNIM